MVKSVEKKKSVAGQFAVKYSKSETYCWTKNLNMEDYGVHQSGVLLAFEKECFCDKPIISRMPVLTYVSEKAV